MKMESHETIIVGAGPAGLQLGYFLEKGGHDYKILERAEMAASFFSQYPHSGQLISINKVHTGSDVYDYNLRHDWNSLLSDEKLSFKEFSKDYYPSRHDLVRYMNTFAKSNALKIQYGAEVKEVKKEEDGTYRLEVVEANQSKLYTCKKLVIATGMSKPNYPTYINNTKQAPKHYADFPPGFFTKPENLEAYRNKSVCILGNGNSAYELANLLTPLCSTVSVHGRRHKEWAMSTHYTGDLRSIYLPFFDTFLLKSLNTFNHINFRPVINQATEGEKYQIYLLCSPHCSIKHEFLSRDTFDHVIFCTGWKMDTNIFSFPIDITENEKYPLLNGNYESTNNPNLFFIGALMHGGDYKKSSGGFIHGFRYLIEYMYHHNYDKKFDTDIFPLKDREALIDHILYKINYTSPMYQMHSFIGDFFWLDSAKKEVIYFNNMNTGFGISIARRMKDIYVLGLTLEFGSNVVKDIYKLGDKESRLGKESNSTLLHPVLRVYKGGVLCDEIHFDEDVFADFTDLEKYRMKLTRTLQMFL